MQLNVAIGGHSGRVHITEVMDEIETVGLSFSLS